MPPARRGDPNRQLTAVDPAARYGPPVSLDTLSSVERRVLWLATSIIHHANKVRPARSGLKVGGHQSSSASAVSILTALSFGHLEGADRLSVKPHAGPVIHAINFLLGKIDADRLTGLRAFGGLQSYPSRTKDPGDIDFSTGSMGLGATAPAWRGIASRYVSDRFAIPRDGRQVAVIGDGELDEGACWEAVLDPTVSSLGELLWVVDVNRQSLDRVVTSGGAGRIGAMFDAAGWNCITLKYGSRLRAIFELPGGEALERRIDEVSNVEYQELLRVPAAELRERLPGSGSDSRTLATLAAELDDATLTASFRDLGGHDLGLLLDAYRAADAVTDRPSVILAYTLKGRMLPTEGHRENHSALLTTEEWRELAAILDTDPDDPWAAFAPESDEGRLCATARQRLERTTPVLQPVAEIPTALGRTDSGLASTQQVFGRLLTDLRRAAPAVAERIVTVSPDVATSTHLGSWINATGIWTTDPEPETGQDTSGAVKWRTHSTGQHIELGIAETNLVGLLGELGLTWDRDGEPLLPIGTLYDPFLARVLEPWAFGLYAGGQSIVVGTPSGITLAPEGGAHQSIVTPSTGIEQPGCIAWEPAFAQDLEWTFLHALSLLGRPDGTSAYFRLSTNPLDQTLAALPADADALEERRRDVLAGGYRLRTAAGAPSVTLVAVGAITPNVLAAADELTAAGVALDVVCLTSPDLLFRALQARRGLDEHDPDDSILDRLFPTDRRAPILTVHDSHPHALAFLSGIHGVPIGCLGVQRFGQSGDVDDLYAYAGLDVDTIVGAALDLLPRR